MSALADIVLEIRKFLTGLAGSITWDMLFYLAIGFELLMIVFFIIKSSFSYEMRMERVLYKLNRWLNVNQYIDQNNLIEFNGLMKKTPKLLRYHWHQYMLYREKDPSFYMSPYNVIEKPLKTSSFSSNIKNLSAINYSIAALAFVVGLSYISSSAFSALELAQVLVIPALILIVNVIAIMLLRARQDRNLSKFYLYFHYFDRKMDKAVTTMPDYVDFEVLFTKKEIKRGIPVLNEYLEKRARQEQEELEKARLNAVEHEVFDFSKAGIDGSLVLERAMKETETYLNFRQRTLGEIQQLESEVESLKRNYENTQKDYQRKLQASKENVDRLRKQQEESTNRIESNYIKKQQQDEVKKQEQLERDFDESTMRFNNDIQTLQTDITSKKAELEEHRKIVEDAMNSEYETFSKKVYEKIDKSIEDRVNEEKQAIIDMKDGISDELQQANFTIEAQKKEIADLRKALENAGVSQGEFEYYNEALREEAKKVKTGKKNKKDDADSALKVETAENNGEEEQNIVAETVEDGTSKKEAEQSEPVYDEYGGYYDAEGYYRYANGTYYDPQGNYHDEFGGYYDPQGNYFPPENKEQSVQESTEQKQDNESENAVEENQQVENEESESLEQISATENIDNNAENVSVEDNQKIETENEVSESEQLVTAKEKDNNQEIESANGNAQEKADVEKPKRKRGRPRKETTETVAENVEKKKRGRPRKTQDATETVKRGRGRPRKENVEGVEENSQKGKVGRPKKDSTTENKVGRPSKTKLAGARKVGRPKKVEETQVEDNAPKKRGRPKKVVAESQDKQSEPAKKRGRPRKEVAEQDLKNVETSATPKKRGRPRKTQDSLDEIKRLNEKILEENLKLQRQQAELNSTLGITLSQLDIKKADAQEEQNAEPVTVGGEENDNK